MPLFESFSYKNYSQIVQSEITFYSNLYDVLHGLIPVSSFLETASTVFIDTITSKNNVGFCSIQMQYECEI